MPPQFIQDSDQQLQMQFLQAQLNLMQEQNAKQSAVIAQQQLSNNATQQYSQPLLQHSHTTSYQPSICTQHDQQIQHNIVEK